MRALLLLLIATASAMASVAILDTFDAPGANIRALAWADSHLYAVDSLSGTVYCLDPSDGSVVSQWSTGYLPNKATGMGATPLRIWISFVNNYIRYYTLSGTYQGSVNLCGS
jgi:outer membrane protein assembly factor BamB